MSSKMPSTTMMTAPSSIPCLGWSRGMSSSTLMINPRKIARPPIRGIGWSCIRRPSRGTSMAPTLTDSAFTSGVVAKDTTPASTSASST